ncbi:MAG TPA: AAA family ATPase [Candidatus Saccharimonadales bacterium]|nr:AAA family ATPase [Candidatus Saccharimonadales bacterium]
MLKNITVEAYRGFRELSVEGLNRVNLFVGQNNSGKTSLLEAAQVIASEGNVGVLLRSLRRRGEIIPANELERNVEEFDVSHLFHGHAMKLGSAFKLEGFNGNLVSVSCEVIRAPQDMEAGQLGIFDVEGGSPLALSLRVGVAPSVNIPLSASGGIPVDLIRRRLGIEGGPGILTGDLAEVSPIRVVPTEGLESRSMSKLWDSVALTPDEPKVIEALQIIEPRIEKIAFLGREAVRSSAGIVVKLKDSDMRLPIGSLGDGVIRLLSLSLSVIRATGGYLMVDEIDTGLHHSVMEGMWRMVIMTAKRLNVQVFATTHSQDCINSLGHLYEIAPKLAAEVSLHRLERGLPSTVRYGPDEISTAAQQEIEVR